MLLSATLNSSMIRTLKDSYLKTTNSEKYMISSRCQACSTIVCIEN